MEQQKVMNLGGVVDRFAKICIVDPTTKMRIDSICGVSVEYSSPTDSGKLAFEDESFDLVKCFGVLMYISNPGVVVDEFVRVLKPGGVILIREPSTDMHVQDGRKRWGMGEKTRGLPPDFYKSVLDGKQVHYSVRHCEFSPWVTIGNKLFKEPLNKRWFVLLDYCLCCLFKFNWKYSRLNWLDKFAPGSVFVKIKKL